MTWTMEEVVRRPSAGLALLEHPSDRETRTGGHHGHDDHRAGPGATLAAGEELVGELADRRQGPG